MCCVDQQCRLLFTMNVFSTSGHIPERSQSGAVGGQSKYVTDHHTNGSLTSLYYESEVN